MIPGNRMAEQPVTLPSERELMLSRLSPDAVMIAAQVNKLSPEVQQALLILIRGMR